MQINAYISSTQEVVDGCRRMMICKNCRCDQLYREDCAVRIWSHHHHHTQTHNQETSER